MEDETQVLMMCELRLTHIQYTLDIRKVYVAHNIGFRKPCREKKESLDDSLPTSLDQRTQVRCTRIIFREY